MEKIEMSDRIFREYPVLTPAFGYWVPFEWKHLEEWARGGCVGGLRRLKKIVHGRDRYIPGIVDRMIKDENPDWRQWSAGASNQNEEVK